MGLMKKFKKSEDAAIMKEGKPEKASLAIAFNVKKHAGKKKMAKGGMVPSGSKADGNPGTPASKPDDHRLPMDEYMANHFAVGGSVQDMDPEQAMHLARHLMSMHSMEPEGTDNDNNPGVPGRKPDDRRLDEDHYMGDKMAQGGTVDAIMQKRRKMAEGGYIDLNPPRVDETENYDSQNGKAARSPLYNDDQLSDDPWDSNEEGDEEEKEQESKLGMVGSIRKKMKLKANRD